MECARRPANEPERIEALRATGVLDTAPEAVFDRLTDLAARICGAPIALITLVDVDRQWFKSRVGLEVQETSRDVAFCAHAILEERTLVVPDALADERFADNPLVTREPHIRFYAGSPLLTRDGAALGTLCVIDTRPRDLTAEQREALEALARHATNLLDMRRTRTRLAANVERLQRAERAGDLENTAAAMALVSMHLDGLVRGREQSELSVRDLEARLAKLELGEHGGLGPLARELPPLLEEIAHAARNVRNRLDPRHSLLAPIVRIEATARRTLELLE